MLSCALRPVLAIALECFKGCLGQCSSNGTTEIPAFNPFARGMGMEPPPLRVPTRRRRKKAPPRQILDFQKSICITILFSEDGAFAVTASIASSLEGRAPNPAEQPRASIVDH